MPGVLKFLGCCNGVHGVYDGFSCVDVVWPRFVECAECCRVALASLHQSRSSKSAVNIDVRMTCSRREQVREANSFMRRRIRRNRTRHPLFHHFRLERSNGSTALVALLAGVAWSLWAWACSPRMIWFGLRLFLILVLSKRPFKKYVWFFRGFLSKSKFKKAIWDFWSKIKLWETPRCFSYLPVGPRCFCLTAVTFLPPMHRGSLNIDPLFWIPSVFSVWLMPPK